MIGDQAQTGRTTEFATWFGSDPGHLSLKWYTYKAKKTLQLFLSIYIGERSKHIPVAFSSIIIKQCTVWNTLSVYYTV